VPANEGRAGRYALIVACDDYEDPGLRKLRAPAEDAADFSRVLADASTGDFKVRTVMNQSAHRVTEEIEGFFADRERDDLLVLYFSCHGVKDDDGILYFATPNTKRNRLGSTAVSSDWVNNRMNRSRSNRIVVLLDCCYSGAFARGMKGDDVVAIQDRFSGRGRVVLTASNAMEYSFEGDDPSGAGLRSVFTRALLKGIESGDADRDGDGLISIDELYDYTYDSVRAVTPNQSPSKWVLGMEGDLYIARSPHPRRQQPGEFPPELVKSIRSPLWWDRAGAVQVLAQILATGDEALVRAAQAALESLAADDDSRQVCDAAATALAKREAAELAKREAAELAKREAAELAKREAAELAKREAAEQGSTSESAATTTFERREDKVSGRSHRGPHDSRRPSRRAWPAGIVAAVAAVVLISIEIQFGGGGNGTGIETNGLGGSHGTTSITTSQTAASTAPQTLPVPDIRPVGGPPWAGSPIVSGAARTVAVAEWSVASSRSTARGLLPEDPGLSPAAAPRRANFSGGWAVAWDDPGKPGSSASGAFCDTCGRGVVGVAGTGSRGAQATVANSTFPNDVRWADGSEAKYGWEGNDPSSHQMLAYLYVAGQDSLYNVWSYLGQAHLEYLLSQLRYVQGAP
jgi:hypothetical protein